MSGPVTVDEPEVTPRQLLGNLRVPAPRAVGSPARLPVFRAASLGSSLLPPKIEWGRVQTQQVAWYQVTFARAFSGTPTVIVNGEHRPGWFDHLTIPPPLLDKSQVGGIVGNAMQTAVVRAVRIPLIGDALGLLTYAIGWVSGFMFAFILNLVTPYLAKAAEIALNFSSELMYAASDRPLMKLTTAEVRNVSAAGFELLGVPNGTYHFIAMGGR